MDGIQAEILTVAAPTRKHRDTATGIPDELRQLEGWVLWRYELGDGPKPRKVPYYVDGGRRYGVQGRPGDRARMVKFDAAKAAAARRGFDGVGLCLLPEFGVVVVDFDNVVGPQGLRADVAGMVSDTYAEFSPGGGGVHAVYRGDLGNNKAHGEPYGLETFSTSGFVTFTGNALPHVADLELAGQMVWPVGEAMRRACAARFGVRSAPDDDPLMNYKPPLGLTDAQIRDALEVLDPDMGHDDWRNVGMALHHETEGQGFHWWDEWSSAGTKYPGTEVLQKRWDSFGREGGRRIGAATLVKMANAKGARVLARAEVLTAAALNEPAQPAGEGQRFEFLTADQLFSLPAADWTIKRVLPARGVGIVFGPSMSGKSFFLLDMVLAVARGVDWRGHRVNQGAVAYVVAEGAGGFPDRLRAYVGHHGVAAPACFRVLPAAPNLLDARDVRDLVARLLAMPDLRVVVVDTLSQTTPGADENSSQDMGRALAHAQLIASSTGALVLLVGHTGKDEAKGLRGWSGMTAAFDVAIRLERSGDMRQATMHKVKDGPGEGDEYPFHLSVAILGKDKDGDDITSCVALPGHQPGARRLPPKVRGETQKLVLRVLQDLEALTGPPTETELLSASREALPKGEGKDRRWTDARRALDSMVAAGTVRIDRHGLAVLA